MKLKKLTQLVIATAVFNTTSVFSAVPSSGDYVNDKTQKYTNNFTQEQMDQINGILCVFNQTNYPEFTNQGPYLSQVDMNACNMGDERDESSVPILSDIVGESTNVNGVQTVTFWIDGLQVGQGNQVLIEGKLIATATPTTINPYGQFSLNYVSYPYQSGVLNRSTPEFKGFIHTSVLSNGQAVVKYFEQQSGNHSGEAALAFVETGQNTGYGKISSTIFEHPMAAKIAFNLNYLENLINRADLLGGQAEICYDRNNYDTSVYRYGLYDSTGARVNRNSGFPIELTIDNEIREGWLSFYGLWLPGNPNLTDGMPASKVNMQTGAKGAGELKIAPGRLELQSAKSIALSELAGTRLRLHSIFENQATAIVTWDSNNEEFIKNAEENCSQNGCTNTPVTPATAIPETDLINNYLGQNYGINISIDGAGGGGFTHIPMRNHNNQVMSLTNATHLVVWTNQLVPPAINNELLTLYCYHHCPIWETNAWSYKNPAWDNSGAPNDYLTYTIEKNITAANNAYTLLDKNGVPFTSNTERLHLGGMVTTPLSQKNDLYDGTVTQKYSWQSGSNPWDQFITFKSNLDNSISSFDPPLNLTYNDDQSKRFLQYEGFGQFHGIPGKCYSRINNQVAEQCNGSDQIWVPDYNIPTGAELTVTANQNVSYYVKQLGVAQNLLPLPTGADKTACLNELQSLIVNADSVTLPSLSDWSDPNLAEMPDVGAVPQVIVGVTQQNG